MPRGIYIRTPEMCRNMSAAQKISSLKRDNSHLLEYCSNGIGRPCSPETREKISKANTGKKKQFPGRVWRVSEEQKKQISKTLQGNKNACGGKGRISPFKGKKHTEEAKIKLRLARRNQLLKIGNIHPAYNPDACEFFELYDSENNFSGQYATNGGEYCVEELGFFLDYINHETKIIIEYDEKHHYDCHEKLRKKDVVRQNMIQEKFPEYKFLRIKE